MLQKLLFGEDYFSIFFFLFDSDVSVTIVVLGQKKGVLWSKIIPHPLVCFSTLIIYFPNKNFKIIISPIWPYIVQYITHFSNAIWNNIVCLIIIMKKRKRYICNIYHYHYNKDNSTFSDKRCYIMSRIM